MKFFELMLRHPYLTLACSIVSSTVLLTLSIAFWLLFIENMMLGIFLGIITYILVGTVIQIANWYFWAQKLTEDLSNEILKITIHEEEKTE